MDFYLGAPEPSWLARARHPLFVSHRRLTRNGRTSWPEAQVRWALDSGGFTELSRYGEWKVSATEYAEYATRYVHEIGMLDFASPQDWMCEPKIRDRTGLTVTDHQHLTIESYTTLTDLAPDVPWMPVLQGWELGDYHAHIEMYEQAGIDLAAVARVGIGSVCRRQHTEEIDEITIELAACGLKLHGFGVKTQGLDRYAPNLVSADSMAWSLRARMHAAGEHRPMLAGCTHQHCGNCLDWAQTWRDELMGFKQETLL